MNKNVIDCLNIKILYQQGLKSDVLIKKIALNILTIWCQQII